MIVCSALDNIVQGQKGEGGRDGSAGKDGAPGLPGPPGPPGFARGYDVRKKCVPSLQKEIFTIPQPAWKPRSSMFQASTGMRNRCQLIDLMRHTPSKQT